MLGKNSFKQKCSDMTIKPHEIKTSQYNNSKNSYLSRPFCFRSRRLSILYPVAPRPFLPVSPGTLSSFHRSITPIGMAPKIDPVGLLVCEDYIPWVQTLLTFIGRLAWHLQHRWQPSSFFPKNLLIGGDFFSHHRWNHPTKNTIGPRISPNFGRWTLPVQKIIGTTHL